MRQRNRSSLRHRLAILAVVGLVVGLLAAVVPVASGAASDNGTNASSGYLIVELTGSAAALDNSTKTNGRFDPTSQGYARALDRMQRQHAKFIQDLSRVAPDATVVDEMFITANAVTIQLNGSDPAAIQRISGVARTEGSSLYTLAMNDSVTLIGADQMWALASRPEAGEGVKVGIIDSGIDPGHEFFDCKAIHFGGVYYSGEGIVNQFPSASAIYGPAYTPGPGDPLYFSSPHGTHVAGEIGGCVTTISDPGPFNGITLSGIAPGAELWDYNVFPLIGAGYLAFDGSAFSHDIAKAIEDAVADGMDVINMSLSGGVQGQHDFLAEVSNAAVDAGVVVVAAAGNEGPGDYTVGSPASGENVIAAGATSNSHFLGIPITTGEPGVYYAVPGEFRTDFDQTAGYYTIIDWPGGDNTACDSSDVGDDSIAAHSVVLISRGVCSFSQKVANANHAGAEGVIVYNDGLTPDREDGIPMATSPGFDDDIPAVMVSHTDGTHLEGVAPLAATFGAEGLYPATPNVLAGFSSRGPVPFTRSVKPDVVAPGTNILSSVFTVDFSSIGTLGTATDPSWELYDGTSMATPHVTGSAVLLLWQNDWTPAQVKSALVTTATDLGYTVWQQGGGLVDIPAADDATAFFTPANASFGFFQGNKPIDKSIDIAIDGSCSAATASGSTYVSASISGSTLTVEFDGGRAAGTAFYGGTVDVTCDSGHYFVPWGAVINR